MASLKLPPGVISPQRICEQLVSRRGFFTDIEAVHLVLAGPSNAGALGVAGDTGIGGVPSLSWVVDVHPKAVHWN
ncbi:MAG: hypothetical protein ACLPYW_12000, partial [Acidimicrobiales bacterium]